jgi:ABC-type polysaccharide/polyol phosphate transport system ATPase subunit
MDDLSQAGAAFLRALVIDRIRFRNVSKRFSLSGGRKLLRGHVRDWLNPSERQTFHALRDVSVTVRDGEGLAVVGANGAGKSTLLHLAARLCYPDEGEVHIHGRLAAVLDLGSGFHSDLTGAENLRVNASLLGLSRKRTAELFDGIVDFSGLGEFIHQPVRKYSAGMVARLAFSIAIQVDPDILVVDEVIAVGDHAFQTKCFVRMLQLREKGKTMLCVSHSPELLRQMCDQGILLDRGQVIAAGNLEEVLEIYQERSTSPSNAQLQPGG